MSIAIVILGCIYILLGVTSIVKKSLWIHQGVIPRPVDKDTYSRFLGLVDIVTGILFAANGFFYHALLPYSLLFAFVLLTAYIGLCVYAECKFKAKEKNKEGDE